jgi:hypothetical protein
MTKNILVFRRVERRVQNYDRQIIASFYPSSIAYYFVKVKLPNPIWMRYFKYN